MQRQAKAASKGRSSNTTLWFAVDGSFPSSAPKPQFHFTPSPLRRDTHLSKKVTVQWTSDGGGSRTPPAAPSEPRGCNARPTRMLFSRMLEPCVVTRGVRGQYVGAFRVNHLSCGRCPSQPSVRPLDGVQAISLTLQHSVSTPTRRVRCTANSDAVFPKA